MATLATMLAAIADSGSTVAAAFPASTLPAGASSIGRRLAPMPVPARTCHSGGNRTAVTACAHSQETAGSTRTVPFATVPQMVPRTQAAVRMQLPGTNSTASGASARTKLPAAMCTLHM